MKDRLYWPRPDRSVRRQLKKIGEIVQTDLVCVLVLVATVIAVVEIFGVQSSSIRTVIGGPLLFFTPGYVIISFLFPRDAPIQAGDIKVSWLPQQTWEFTDAERAALSFGLSVLVLPVFGLAISISPLGFTDSTVIGTVSAFVLIGAVFVAIRRASISSSDRYTADLGRRLSIVRTAIFDTKSTLAVATNIVLAISVLFALTSVGYAFVTPQQGEQYTSLQLLTENESGEFVASGYPSEVEPGESIPLVISLENREQQDVNYTVIVQQQRVGDGVVVQRTELQETRYELSHGESIRDERMITPTADEGFVRISVLVYRGDIPETPTNNNAYRHAFVWTEVTENARSETDDVTN